MTYLTSIHLASAIAAAFCSSDSLNFFELPHTATIKLAQDANIPFPTMKQNENCISKLKTAYHN